MSASIAIVLRRGNQLPILKIAGINLRRYLRGHYSKTYTYTYASELLAPAWRCVFYRAISSGHSRRCFIQNRFRQTNCRFYSLERTCWKCGRNTSAPSELFFCDCGMVQAPASDLDYFTLFGMKFDFDININELSKMYKDLQRKLHPDKFSLKSEEERHMADQQSSLVNKAYFILLKPLSRGLYMLDYSGYPIEESTGDVDPEFLMDIMEMNERLDEADSREEVKEIEEEINSLVRDIIVKISAAFKSKDLIEAKKLMIKYQYFGNIEDKIRERYRKDMH